MNQDFIRNLEKYYVTPIIAAGDNLNQTSIFLNSFFPILNLHQTLLEKMSQGVPQVIKDEDLESCREIVVSAITEHIELFKL